VPQENQGVQAEGQTQRGLALSVLTINITDMEKATIRFMPVIYKDEHLNRASQGIGTTECHVFGETEVQLFENIREKIWAMSSEAAILDEATAKRYNQWIADGWKTSVPECINNMGQRDMRFALPYSEKFKQWLRKNN
jgi:hypothetical protein